VSTPLLLATLLFALAGSCDTCGGDEESEQQPAPAAQASAVVGPEGGDLELGSQLVLRVPEGALEQPTELSVREVADEVTGFELLSSVYEFEPDGLQLREPAVITLKFDPDRLPEGSGADSVLLYWTDAEGALRPRAGVVRDAANSTVTGVVWHFSRGAAGASSAGTVCCASNGDNVWTAVADCCPAAMWSELADEVELVILGGDPNEPGMVYVIPRDAWEAGYDPETDVITVGAEIVDDGDCEQICCVEDGQPPQRTLMARDECSARQGTPERAVNCPVRACCQIGDAYQVVESPEQCDAWGGEPTDEASCEAVCCVSAADSPEELFRGNCRQQGASVHPLAECEEVCCPEVNRQGFISRYVCGRDGGSPADESECGRICCVTEEERWLRWPDECEGTQEPAALCQAVCCNETGQLIGRDQVAELCPSGEISVDVQHCNVCCVLDDQAREGDRASCQESGGELLPLSSCEEVCCGRRALMPRAVCEREHPGLQITEPADCEVCCELPGGKELTDIQDCQDQEGTALPREDCCGDGTVQEHEDCEEDHHCPNAEDRCFACKCEACPSGPPCPDATSRIRPESDDVLAEYAAKMPGIVHVMKNDNVPGSLEGFVHVTSVANVDPRGTGARWGRTPDRQAILFKPPTERVEGNRITAQYGLSTGRQVTHGGRVTITVELVEPEVVCGDGTWVSWAEGCDDGNLDDGDLCDSSCQLEACPDGATVPWRVFRDADGDREGTPDDLVYTCEELEGYVDNSTDCDDSDRNVSDAEHERRDQCDDGIDNDCDMSVDCADIGCVDEPHCTEWDCADGLDNDGDGGADCADPECKGDDACRETNCADGIDEDGDGLTDCDDLLDCAWRAPCSEGDCEDGVDGDSDGATDCDDDDCQFDNACI